MLLHACDGCGAAIRPDGHFNEVVCGDCSKEGLPTVAHTACETCVRRGVDVVRLALLHQISAHGLPRSALEAEEMVFEPWKIRRRQDRTRAFPPGPLVTA